MSSGSADSALRATDPNFGYGVYLRNSPRSEVRNASCFQAGGAFLAGASTNEAAEGIRVFGGTVTEHHDTGFYGSTAFDMLIIGTGSYHGLSNACKTRGSRNKIQSCFAFGS